MQVSGSLLLAHTIPVGSEIWTDDEEGDQVWIQAEVIRQENTSLTIRRKSMGEELKFDLVRRMASSGVIIPHVVVVIAVGPQHATAVV